MPDFPMMSKIAHVMRSSVGPERGLNEIEYVSMCQYVNDMTGSSIQLRPVPPIRAQQRY